MSKRGLRFVFLAVIVISLTLSVVYSFVGIVVSQGKYCGSRKSDVYHYPWCHYVEQIKPENLIWFADEYDAVSKGYRPCKVCKPPYPGQQTSTQTSAYTFTSTPTFTTISTPRPTPTLTSSAFTSTEVVSSSMTTTASITSATAMQTATSDRTLTSLSTPMSTFTQATSTTTQPAFTVTSVLVVTSVTTFAAEESISTILTSLLLILLGGTGLLAYRFWRKRKAE